MRILVDYRPALRARSGVGEWVHQLSRAMLAAGSATTRLATRLELVLFSASWKDRVAPEVAAELDGATIVDRAIPARLLRRAWNRLGWPPVDWLVPGPLDVVLSPSPLCVPTARALGVITVHDLDFLDHPERTYGEMRTDFPRLVRAHAARADLVIAVSRHTAAQVESRLGVPPAKLTVCRAGLPGWTRQARSSREPPGTGHVLFVGTLEPRKNIPGLLDAYERLLSRGPVPPLVLAGAATGDQPDWRRRLDRPPLAGRVHLLGYVEESQKSALFRDAALLVLPSFEEGFGLPVLEAMAVGVPVIASRAGAIPEVLGDAGILVTPGDSGALADAMARVLEDRRLSDALRERGQARAGAFDWAASAQALLETLGEAVTRKARTRAAQGRG